MLPDEIILKGDEYGMQEANGETSACISIGSMPEKMLLLWECEVAELNGSGREGFSDPAAEKKKATIARGCKNCDKPAA